MRIGAAFWPLWCGPMRIFTSGWCASLGPVPYFAVWGVRASQGQSATALVFFFHFPGNQPIIFIVFSLSVSRAFHTFVYDAFSFSSSFRTSKLQFCLWCQKCWGSVSLPSCYTGCKQTTGHPSSSHKQSLFDVLQKVIRAGFNIFTKKQYQYIEIYLKHAHATD